MITLIKATYSDIVRYFWPLSKRSNLIRSVLLLGAIIFILAQLQGTSKDTTSLASEVVPTVVVGTVNDNIETASAAFIGTVRATSEAQIQSEVSGPVTSVRVKAGDVVAPGAIIATLENAAEQAAVLQAQGSYEAALAAAQQSEVSVADAQTALLATQNAARTAIRNAYTSINGTTIETIDQFFSNPDFAVPGVRIDSSMTATLNSERVALEQELNTLKVTTQNQISTTQIDTLFVSIADTTEHAIGILIILAADISRAKNNDVLLGQPVTSYAAGVNTAINSLNNVIASLETAAANIDSATDALRAAEIASTNPNTDITAANAQIKQALGSLRSAQANLAKTILRAPIGGTVNSVSINTGDFLSAFTPVAEVANNNALEISLFVGEKDLPSFTLGESVIIDGSATGTITNIAPAIDPTTGKIEVKIGAESTTLTNGQTVAVTVAGTVAAPTSNQPIKVPISAVKFSATDGVMFVVENGVLTSLPVVVGPVSGSLVTILSGIDKNTVFVLDARGLSAGTAVEAVRLNN